MSIIIKRKTNFRFKRNLLLEVDVVTEHGILGRAAVPSGAQLENMRQ
jgi:enolase